MNQSVFLKWLLDLNISPVKDRSTLSQTCVVVVVGARIGASPHAGGEGRVGRAASPVDRLGSSRARGENWLGDNGKQNDPGFPREHCGEPK